MSSITAVRDARSRFLRDVLNGVKVEPMGTRSVIDVAETAYDLEGDDVPWLERVLAAAAPHLFRGLGGVGALIDMGAPDPHRT